jgi:hypothetical protein
MATFTPTEETTLVPRGPASYERSGPLDPLVRYLENLGFYRQPPRSDYECLRMRSGRGALIIFYHSGTLLVQGKHPAQTHAQLQRFTTESEVR